MSYRDETIMLFNNIFNDQNISKKIEEGIFEFTNQYIELNNTPLFLLEQIYNNKSKEITDILKNKKIKFNRFKIYLRIFSKLTQLIFINQNKINKNFNHFFYEKISNYNANHQFKIISNIEKIPNFKNYILVAINLAFLGYWIKLKKFNVNNILFWPDGIFSKFIKAEIKKIPGRDLIKKIARTTGIPEQKI
jgi:hypothetical protein